MNQKTKNIILAIVIVAIIGTISYLEVVKPHEAPGQDIIVTNAGTFVGSTTSVSNYSASATTTATTTPSSALKTTADRTAIRVQKALQYPRAKEFVDPTGFINTAPFKLSDIVGQKVVLIDFWTYSCINCQRTIPYLNAWYQKYKDYGLEIVGVHTPEFDFEKDISNVQTAVKQLGIQYPVVLDSNMGTWDAYQNEYWPAEYLIDIDGFIVHNSIGEGEYSQTEIAIQAALKERDAALGLSDNVPTGIVNPSDAVSMDSTKVQSPETYFGSARNEYLADGIQGQAGLQTLSLPSDFQSNELYLAGTWNFKDQYAESTSPASSIVFEYDAKNVYMVASSENPNGTPIKVYEDGTLVNSLTITGNTLYTLISGSSYGAHTMKIEVDGPGLDAYTFTFG